MGIQEKNKPPVAASPKETLLPPPSAPPPIPSPLPPPDPADKKTDKSTDEMVTTQVDDLINLLTQFPKLPLDDAAKRLNVSKKVLKSWIDFLVEEKILGIEYSFTTPYIYLNRPAAEEKTKKVLQERFTWAQFKNEFFEKARKSNIPEDKIKGFWRDHVKQKLDANKEYFLREVAKREIPLAEELWTKYIRYVESQ